MATKKAASKGAAIIKWDEKFAAAAKKTKEQTADIGAGGEGIKWGHGTITVGKDKEIKSGKIEVIIAGFIFHKKYFENSYDADNPEPPDCYAFSILSNPKSPDLHPHPNAPSKQDDGRGCAECDKNVFGTARQGNGKACADTERLGLILADDCDDAESTKLAEIRTAGVSPTNLRHYKKYVDDVADEHGRPPWAVVTEITSLHDDKTQIRLEFRMVSLIDDDDVLTVLEARSEKAQETLSAPYAVMDKTKGAGKKGDSRTGAGRKFAATPAKKAAKKR